MPTETQNLSKIALLLYLLRKHKGQFFVKAYRRAFNIAKSAAYTKYKAVKLRAWRIKTKIANDFAKPTVDDKLILAALGLSVSSSSQNLQFLSTSQNSPKKPQNRIYSSVRFAADSTNNCVAVLHELPYNSENILSLERQTELADLAIRAGATLLVATNQIKNYPCLVVDNPYIAMLKISAEYTRRTNTETIAITGSTGKTTTTQFVQGVLQTHKKTLSTDIDVNGNALGSAISRIRQLTKSHKYYVQEAVEFSEYGNAGDISTILQPKAAIITNIGVSGIERFAGQEEILAKCLEIRNGLQENGVLYLNGDDELLAAAKLKIEEDLQNLQNAKNSGKSSNLNDFGEKSHKIVLFGINNPQAEFRAVNISETPNGINFDVLHNDKKFPVQINFLGRHNIYNALAAFAVAKNFGMADAKIAAAISQIKPIGIRQNLLNIGDFTVFLDCYNAAPSSVFAALETLKNLSPKNENSKKIALLGDIGGLGDFSQDYHRKIGEFAANSAVDLLICYGEKAADFAVGAENAKNAQNAKNPIKILKTADFAEICQIIAENFTTDDILLIKGSRFMQMEKIVDNFLGTHFYEGYDFLLFKDLLKQQESGLYRANLFPNYAVITKFNGADEVVRLPETLQGLPVCGIDENAFAHRKNLRRVVMPSTVRSVRYCAFYNCVRLNRVTFAADLRIIGRSAFNMCFRLNEIVLNDNLIEIGEMAFYGCEGLSAAYIPPSVGLIGENAFGLCHNLTIFGQVGSFAEKYAADNNIPFKAYYFITSQFICGNLGILAEDLPLQNQKNRTFNKLRFAEDSKNNDVAFLVELQPEHMEEPPNFARQAELAQIAMENGAALLVSTEQIADFPCLVVADVYKAFRILCRSYRELFSAKCVAITGSIGKTSATRFIYEVLNANTRTLRIGENSNANDIRLMSHQLQRLNPQHEMYVQEVKEGPPFGTAHTESLMIKPNAAVITNVGTAHMEYFGSQERILESCLQIQDGMVGVDKISQTAKIGENIPNNENEKNGENGRNIANYIVDKNSKADFSQNVIFLNADDNFQLTAQTKVPKIFYSIHNEQAEYRAFNIKSHENGLDFEIGYQNKKIPVHINFTGEHNVYNALAAFAIAKWANISDENIKKSLEIPKPVGIRQNLSKIGGYTLYMDCFNASPESIATAFQTIKEFPLGANGRRIALVADMTSMGDYTEIAHQNVGKSAVENDVDILICYGESSAITAAAVDNSLENGEKSRKTRAIHVVEQAELVQIIRNEVTRDDIFLVKGSSYLAPDAAVDEVFGTWFNESRTESNDRASATVVKLHEEIRTEEYDFMRSLNYVRISKYTNITKTEEIVKIPKYYEDLPVRSIGNAAFSYKIELKEIILPKTLLNIRNSAFFNCTALTAVKLPPNLKIIDRSAFAQCTALKTVDLGDEVIEIGINAFYNCNNLLKINIPPSVGNIGENAFYNCKKLTIYGKIGSLAEKYAAANKIKFVQI
ncbi:MAG: Mur ligase family protein [Firmicutes bacterium]|nr:Mur ligase family protein [Bacillota bacterium]